MRLIKPNTVHGWMKRFPDAAASLRLWMAVVRSAEWESFAELRASCPKADQVRVKSGRTIIVFNIAWNSFRLIGAAHYDRQKFYCLKFLTHAEYSKDKWKADL